MSKTPKEIATTAQAKAVILADIAEAMDNLADVIARCEAEREEYPDDYYIGQLEICKEQYRIYSALLGVVDSYEPSKASE